MKSVLLSYFFNLVVDIAGGVLCLNSIDGIPAKIVGVLLLLCGAFSLLFIGVVIGGNFGKTNKKTEAKDLYPD